MSGNQKTFRIALVPGDGIGPEVVPAAVQVLEAAGKRFGISFEWKEFPWGCTYYTRHGRMMPEDGIASVRGFDSILLGAVGYPGVPDHVSLWGLLIPLRRELRQYVNLRPIRLLPGIRTPLAGRAAKDIDFVIVRENNEGEYSSIGGRAYGGTDDEFVVQESIFTRKGVDRIQRYAFELAQKRRGHLTSATKSNGIAVTMPYWDERFAENGKRYPDVRTAQFHIDILAAHFVQRPDIFDVVVASNLFGDILSDLGAAIAGSIGLAPAGNINPEREFPSMFEPVHGSAPDIAGKAQANPIAEIASGAMMLEHLGCPEAAAAINAAIERVLAEGKCRTRDLGGGATTAEMTRAVEAVL
jgi:tartrate dehydrogenase/decarboxylase/D-malate dehydrogenase